MGEDRGGKELVASLTSADYSDWNPKLRQTPLHLRSPLSDHSEAGVLDVIGKYETRIRS
jgi:hypothetical protein